MAFLAEGLGGPLDRGFLLANLILLGPFQIAPLSISAFPQEVRGHPLPQQREMTEPTRPQLIPGLHVVLFKFCRSHSQE